MPTKTVPLSVRVPMEDAEFISELEVPGATTPSEKLRTIISNTRKRLSGRSDYQGALRNFHELMAASITSLKKHEHTEKMRSELIQNVTTWAAETLAYLCSEIPDNSTLGDNEIRKTLIELETATADRAFGLVETLLRMGVTSNSNCYSATVVQDRLDPVMEIFEVIKSTRNK